MILDQIIIETRRELERRQRLETFDSLAARAAAGPAPRGFARRLGAGPLTCIAEFKRRSPSAGWIRQDGDPVAVARAYASAGAAALSILTDGPFFGGALADITRVRDAAVGLPILRKDFVVDRYQIAEARAAGADAVLLILAVLSDAEAASLLAQAQRFGLDALVETHTEAEVERARALGAGLIGINHRDLDTLAIDMSLAIRLRPTLPAATTVVAESGLKSADDVRRMRRGGIDAILVGEGLLKADDPGRALTEMMADE